MRILGTFEWFLGSGSCQSHYLISENDRVLKDMDALINDLLAYFAQIMNQLDVSLNEEYEAGSFELDTLLDEHGKLIACWVPEWPGLVSEDAV